MNLERPGSMVRTTVMSGAVPLKDLNVAAAVVATVPRFWIRKLEENCWAAYPLKSDGSTTVEEPPVNAP